MWLVIHQITAYPLSNPIGFRAYTNNKVKEYFSNPPILVPPMPERPFILYLTIHEKSMGCVPKQHDEIKKKKWAIYYLNKKFICGKDMLLPNMDCWKAKAIHAMSYYMDDHKVRSYQIHLRKIFSFRKDREMEGFTIRVWHTLCLLECHKRECDSWISCWSSFKRLWTNQIWFSKWGSHGHLTW